MLRTREKPCARCYHSDHPARNFERGTVPCLQNADVTKPHYRGGCAAFPKVFLRTGPGQGLAGLCKAFVVPSTHFSCKVVCPGRAVRPGAAISRPAARPAQDPTTTRPALPARAETALKTSAAPSFRRPGEPTAGIGAAWEAWRHCARRPRNTAPKHWPHPKRTRSAHHAGGGPAPGRGPVALNSCKVQGRPRAWAGDRHQAPQQGRCSQGTAVYLGAVNI